MSSLMFTNIYDSSALLSKIAKDNVPEVVFLYSESMKSYQVVNQTLFCIEILIEFIFGDNIV